MAGYIVHLATAENEPACGQHYEHHAEVTHDPALVTCLKCGMLASFPDPAGPAQRTPEGRAWAYVWLVLLTIAAGCLFALLGGCARGVGESQWPTPCRAAVREDSSCKYVARIVRIESSQAWSSTGWYRTGDLFGGSVTVLVTSDRQGCVVGDRVAAVARETERWPCPGGWRAWRPGR